tara:strand:+ start:510 stop:749 length:240 start_codon:yes stop_codon:yes gene_type:complete
LDIKIIGGLVAILFSFGGLFVQVGTIMTRLDNVEARSIPDISNVEKEISEVKTNLEKEISIIKKDIEELKAKNSNPLMR